MRRISSILALLAGCSALTELFFRFVRWSSWNVHSKRECALCVSHSWISLTTCQGSLLSSVVYPHSLIPRRMQGPLLLSYDDFRPGFWCHFGTQLAHPKASFRLLGTRTNLCNRICMDWCGIGMMTSLRKLVKDHLEFVLVISWCISHLKKSRLWCYQATSFWSGQELC